MGQEIIILKHEREIIKEQILSLIIKENNLSFELKIWRGNEYNQRARQQILNIWIIIKRKKVIC